MNAPVAAVVAAGPGSGRCHACRTNPDGRHAVIPLAPCLIGSSVLALFVAAPLSSWYASLLTA